MADVNWAHGTLVTPKTPDEPLGALDRDDGSVARLLDEAEDIVNSVGPEVMAESTPNVTRGPPLAPLAPPQRSSARGPRPSGGQRHIGPWRRPRSS